MSVAITNRVVAGGVGAGVLTWLHQVAQHVRADAPRMDLVAMEAIARGLAVAGAQAPGRDRLFTIALLGDLTSNAAYYAAIPAETRRATWTRAVALGLLAGAGALLLPRYVVGNDPPHSTSIANSVMTVAWYLAGGLATAAAVDLMRARSAGTPASEARA